MGNIRKTYTKDEKLKAVKLYIDGGLSYQAVANTLNIPSAKTVRLWVKRVMKPKGNRVWKRNEGRPSGWLAGKGVLVSAP